MSGPSNHKKAKPLNTKYIRHKPGHLAQSVTFLATDASLPADPGVASFVVQKAQKKSLKSSAML